MRYTKKVIEPRVKLVNGILKRGYSINLGCRYGYYAIDLYQGDQCVRMIQSGTAKEIYIFLTGMIECGWLCEGDV